LPAGRTGRDVGAGVAIVDLASGSEAAGDAQRGAVGGSGAARGQAFFPCTALFRSGAGQAHRLGSTEVLGVEGGRATDQAEVERIAGQHTLLRAGQVGGAGAVVVDLVVGGEVAGDSQGGDVGGGGADRGQAVVGGLA